jgi:hypothetical protein
MTISKLGIDRDSMVVEIASNDGYLLQHFVKSGSSVEEFLEREVRLGYTDLDTYSAFAEKVRETKRKLLEFLIEAIRDGKSVVGYGAPGKGNTLLNYCGIRTEQTAYVREWGGRFVVPIPEVRVL